MGIYGAINAAISGLTAQSRALENISGNVANSQTVGFKRLDTTFSEMVAGSGGGTQAKQQSGTTAATSRATNTVAGPIVQAQVDTYMAINGPGYFVVTQASDVVDGKTTFADTQYYTRAGDFERDQYGYLVNSSGYYLKGFPLDPLTGNAIGDAPSVIQIDDKPMPSKATTEMTYQANLPTFPKTNRAVAAGNTPGSQYLQTGGSTSITTTSDITVADQQAFVDSSISGGSKTIYDANGAPVSVSLRWAQTSANTWNLYYNTGETAPATATAWSLVGEVDFTASGVMNTLTPSAPNTASATSFTIANLTVGGVNAGNVELSFDNGSLTQFNDDAGIVSSLDIQQNGYPAGQVVSLSIDEAGRITASYSNNQQRAVYEIPIATFQAEQNLRRVDGAAFAATPTSGEPKFGEGGAVLANNLESSNSDIATEFSKLIITQQAYSANSKVITSSDKMLTDALNMIR
ncbi:flagellar hook protein FlgE [Pannonibacter indicus]|uniref:Flagellar hook protein FlgE n=1 Tax=Pannonibacter indicus TaxID=466044 RepID=A0A0K6HLI4_9HYPH|nr:flagellar hook-basal body complex protein [Pannonibacter indicus]CUA91785.1 flagellar hook-basal body protein [Pannonibacter indicus]